MVAAKVVNCSIQRALGEVGERWSLLIIREAVMGSTRFVEFHERIGVARNILTDRLQTLVSNNILERKASPENARLPLYTLTQKGLELWPVLVSIMQWGDRWIHKDIGAPIVLLDRNSGQPLQRVALSSKTGKPIAFSDIKITAGPGATSVMKKRLKD